MEERTAVKKGSITTQTGSIIIAEEVVSNIAGIAVMEVEGVAAVSGGWGSGIIELLKKKDFSKGVKVELAEKEAAIDVYLAVDFKYPIPGVAAAVQEKVKSAVEARTGLAVKEVNVHVVAVSVEKAEPASEPAEAPA